MASWFVGKLSGYLLMSRRGRLQNVETMNGSHPRTHTTLL